MSTATTALPAEPASPGLLQPILGGIIASFVAFAGTFTIILNGFIALGATPIEAASGLLMVVVLSGIFGIVLSIWFRMPITAAWSTPGSVLFATTGAIQGGYSAAVGAFIAAGLLIVATGMIKPFGRLVASIPPVLASAMMAGILLGLCLAPVKAVALEPAIAVPVILVWAIVGRFAKIWAVPAAVVVTVGLIVWFAPPGAFANAHVIPQITFITPRFDAHAMISLAIPLFIVTMASQNLPGIAVMRINGFEPPLRAIFVSTGLGSMFGALFGAHSLNLAALTASLCCGPEAHPEPSKRWVAAVSGGVAYVILGLGATLASSLIAIAPAVVIQAATGLALLGAFGASLAGATADPRNRDAAMVTFVTAGSGLSFWGISAAFWGLIAGGAFMLLNRNWKTSVAS